jgi:hypothetical protein
MKKSNMIPLMNFLFTFTSDLKSIAIIL